MKFTKMQGCGNDYIYVNCFDETVPDPSAAAIRLSDRPVSYTHLTLPTKRIV